MPIYEYKCESCGREKEILHKRIPKKKWIGCDKCKGVMKHVLSSTSDPVVHGFSEKNSYSHTKDIKKDVKKDNKEKT